MSLEIKWEPSLSTVKKWSIDFENGTETMEDDPHSATMKENVKEIEKIVLEDDRKESKR